jgi:hypothetical protein
MRILLTLLFLLFAGKAVSQQLLSNLCDKNKYAVAFFYKGDTVVIPCDTLVLVNTSTYRLYDLIFKNKGLNKNEKLLNSLYDNAKILYETRIAEQQKEIQKLASQNDSLIHASLKLVQSAIPQLGRLDTSLVQAAHSVEKANVKIDEAIGMMQSEVRSSNKRKLKWGAGGFVLGIVTTAIIFAIGD